MFVRTGWISLDAASRCDVLHVGPLGSGVLRTGCPGADGFYARRAPHSLASPFGLATVAFGLSQNFCLSEHCSLRALRDMISVFIRSINFATPTHAAANDRRRASRRIAVVILEWIRLTAVSRYNRSRTKRPSRCAELMGCGAATVLRQGVAPMIQQITAGASVCEGYLLPSPRKTDVLAGLAFCARCRGAKYLSRREGPGHRTGISDGYIDGSSSVMTTSSSTDSCIPIGLAFSRLSLSCIMKVMQ